MSSPTSGPDARTALTLPRAKSTLHFRLPLLLWVAVILAVSSIPGPTLQGVGFTVQDSLAHLVEYAILGFLAYRLLRAEGRGVTGALLGSLILGAALGALDENYQRVIPGRMTTWADYLADLTGAALGALVAAVYYRWTGRFRGSAEARTSGDPPDGGEER